MASKRADTEIGRKVGIYDRPASADRNSRWVWLIAVIGVAAAGVGAYYFLGA